MSATALVPTPVGGQQNSQNEFDVLFNGQGFTTFKGSYHNWLPAIDFDIEPLHGVKLRASYSHTITRADYGSLQGGRRLDTLFRIGGGTGSVGNPGLIPYKSKNVDLSAEWYYGNESFLSIGYFHKDVANFISSTQINTTIAGVAAPTTNFRGVVQNGPRYQAALDALGANATIAQIQQYYATNFPNYVGAIDGFEFGIQHNFWHTGFGTILNYTIVNSNRNYNNALPASVQPGQFAVVGLSDSANAVLFYDKHGFQARIAYNWRASFLSGTGVNPTYTDAYGQVDASASYALTKNVEIIFDGINLNGENRTVHLRSDRNIAQVQKQPARYSAGVRFAF